ncbi:MAG: imidazole glycerol phosphate synthase subunit HisH [Ignavibacteriaceae bacterium]|nr:imidazole glycerol phosphate synthase subunit HisH [Ignavibacteriaceae bacterium]
MISVINYKTDDLTPIEDALKQLGAEYKVTAVETEICAADKIIFPGTKDARSAIKKVHLLNLFSMLRMIKKPILGIGLGMQLLCEFSCEGNVACLGHFPVRVSPFEAPGMRIPNLGSFNITPVRDCLLYKGVDTTKPFSFHNSFFVGVNDYTTATSENGILFSASIKKDNCFGVQFHPELSGEEGIKVLKNFIEYA